MRRKYQEFMNLKQGRRSMHDYTKLFNHLAQYVLDQVDTEEKKKNPFMIGFTMKLQEHMHWRILSRVCQQHHHHE
jgi:hypothetical protein